MRTRAARGVQRQSVCRSRRDIDSWSSESKRTGKEEKRAPWLELLRSISVMRARKCTLKVGGGGGAVRNGAWFNVVACTRYKEGGTSGAACMPVFAMPRRNPDCRATLQWIAGPFRLCVHLTAHADWRCRHSAADWLGLNVTKQLRV